MRRLLLVLVVCAACGTPPPVATDQTTTTAAPPTTTTIVANSRPTTTEVATTVTEVPEDNPWGRRLVVAERREPDYTCGPVIFRGGLEPEPVDSDFEPAQVLPHLDVPGLDQEQFYEIYDWTIVVDAGDWITLLGRPNTDAGEELYPGSFGVTEIGRLSGEWMAVTNDWCDPRASAVHFAGETASTSMLRSSAYRESLTKLIAGIADASDREILFGTEPEELYAASPATWAFDPEIEPEPGSSIVPMVILERGCANGLPPEDDEIIVHATQLDAGLALTVFIEPPGGGAASCPGNPWYPIVVELDGVWDGPLLDGGVLPPEVRTWPPDLEATRR